MSKDIRITLNKTSKLIIKMINKFKSRIRNRKYFLKRNQKTNVGAEEHTNQTKISTKRIQKQTFDKAEEKINTLIDKPFNIKQSGEQNEKTMQKIIQKLRDLLDTSRPARMCFMGVLIE